MDNITSILFDLDGTLIDTKIYFEIYNRIISIILRETNQTLEQLKIQADFLQIKKNTDERYDTGEICSNFGLSDRYYEILEEEVKSNNYLKKHVMKILKFIKSSRPEIKVGIVSNSFEKTINTYIKLYSLSKYIDFVCGSDTTKSNKSNKSFWQYVINEKKVIPYSSIMVGDNLLEDTILPKQYGFKTIHIRHEDDIKNVLKLLDIENKM